MFGIVDGRFGTSNHMGILRGKSKTIKNAIRKSRVIYKHLQTYEDNVNPLDLHIVKLVGRICLGDSVEHNQITKFPV